MIKMMTGTVGNNRYLVLTAQDASQVMGSKPNLKVYRCEQQGEVKTLLGKLSNIGKTDVCQKLNIGCSFHGGYIGSSFYDNFLIEQFKSNNLHMYFTGASHYTDSKNILAENAESTYYLVPAIYGLEYHGAKFFPFASKAKIAKAFVDRLSLEEMKAELLVRYFYNSTGKMYKNGAPMFPLPEHYENHLVQLLVDGEAIVINKPKSLFVPAGEEETSTAVSPSAAASEPVDKTCQPFTTFAIRCAHHGKGRDFQLNVLETAPSFIGSNGIKKHVIQVVAQTGKPEIVRIEHEKNSCKHGEEDCPVIVIHGGEYSHHKTTTKPFKLNAKPYKKEENLTFLDFLQTELLPDLRDLKPQKYRVFAKGCKDVNMLRAEVHCYPIFSWDAKATFNYVVDTEERADIKTGFAFEGKVTYQRDDNKLVKYDTKSESNKTSAFSTLQNALSGIFDKIDEMNSKVKSGEDTKLVTLDLEYPKLELNGKLDLEEHPQNGEVGMVGHLGIKMDPLIGFTGNVDIIEWIIIGCAGPLADAIKKARKLAAGEGNDDQKIKASISLDLKPTGKISSDFKWEKSIDNSWLSKEGEKSGEAKAEIAFELVGEAKAEGDFYWVKIEAGVTIGVKAMNGDGGVGITATLTSTTAGDKPALAGQLHFSGMKATYSCFVKSSVKKAESGDSDGGFGGVIKKKLKVLNQEVKKEDELPIFDEFKWPSDPTPTAITQGHI
ncbi:MAG: hypothetical protein JKY50_06460 [Oleispira sp.]|nr:hypothetical protein [Oleispira sp.]MBL4881813.1 hypothetical protein [Oleispira sp.]